MAESEIIFTRHAETVVAERAIERRWVERTIREPNFVERDPTRGTVNAFRSIPEHGGRILRVTYVNDGTRVRIITVFFDRRRRP